MYDQIRNNTNMFDVCALLYLWMWIYVCVLFVKIVLYIDSVATWALLKSAKNAPFANIYVRWPNFELNQNIPFTYVIWFSASL